MNKIIIENNILKEVDNEVFSVHANQITIKKNGEYTIEYQNCSSLSCEFKIRIRIISNVYQATNATFL